MSEVGIKAEELRDTDLREHLNGYSIPKDSVICNWCGRVVPLDKTREIEDQPYCNESRVASERSCAEVIEDQIESR